MDAIEGLFEAQADALYRYARYMTGSGYEAEDIVQSVFLRAVRSWSSFGGRSSPETWLWSIARHVLVDWERGAVRERRLRDASVPTEATAHRDPELTGWERILLDLPMRERQVVTLRIVEDLSTADTARRLEMSEVHIRVTLHKALARLRKQLEQKEGNT